MTNTELKALRKAKGWTQAELANAAGVSRGNISDYEHSRKGITRTAGALFRILLKPDNGKPKPPPVATPKG